MPEISREYRQIKKKRDNLVDVIHYEEIAQVNDSILRLVQMSEGERLAYFTEITNALRDKAIADSIALAKKQQTADFVNNEFFLVTKIKPNPLKTECFTFITTPP